MQRSLQFFFNWALPFVYVGNSLAARGPLVGAPIRHNLGKRAVPLPPASDVTVVPAAEGKTNAEESPEMTTEMPMEEPDTAATMGPTDGNTDSTVEQGTTPIEGTVPETTQTPSGETDMTSDVTKLPWDISGVPSEEPAGSTLITTGTPLEVTSIGEIPTTQAAETTAGTATPTPVQENNFTAGMETTAKPETKTPSMTETAAQPTLGDTTPQLPVSSSSPLTEIPTTPPIEVPTTPPIQVPTTLPAPITTIPPTSSPTTPPTRNPPTLPTPTQSPTTPSTQRPSTLPTQSPPLPSTQAPTSYPTQRPSSQFPNLPYMPNPMLLPMGLDEFMGRIGVTKTSKRPANLPSLSRPMSPVPLL